MGSYSNSHYWSWRSSLIASCAIAAAVLAFRPGIVRAGEEQISVETQLANVRAQVDRAVLIVAPRPEVFAFNRGMDEDDLPRIGCIYELDNPASVAPLLDIISKAQFPDDPESKDHGLLMGIYLYSHVKKVGSLLFGQWYRNRDVQGIVNGRRVTVKGSFEREIRALVAKTKPKVIHVTCEGESPDDFMRRNDGIHSN